MKRPLEMFPKADGIRSIVLT